MKEKRLYIHEVDESQVPRAERSVSVAVADSNRTPIDIYT